MKSHQAKVIWFISISIVIVLIATIVYYFQTNLLDTSADTSETYSKLCISGKINGADTTKCYSNDETDEMQVKTIGETLNLQTGENYDLEFTLGDFHTYSTELDVDGNITNSLLPVSQRCQPAGYGRWEWQWLNCGSMCATSTVYWLTVGLDTDVFNTDNFSDVSGSVHSITPDYGTVDDSKTITTIHDTDLSPAIRLTGYASHKDGGDIPKYNPELANKLSQCSSDVNKYDIVKYSGQHNPGDKVSMSFTPKVEYQGNLGGYNANGHRSSGDVYGAGLIVPVDITAGEPSPTYTATDPTPNETSIPPINDMSVVNNEDGSIEFFWSHTGDSEIYKVLDCVTEEEIDERVGVGFGNYSLKLESLENGEHCYVLVAYDENNDEIARSDNYSVTVENGIVSDISNSDSNNSSDDSTSNDSSKAFSPVANIDKLASTGASIWVNLAIALVLIIIVGIIIFRKKS